MKRIFLISLVLLGLVLASSYAQETKSKVILLISEQNIEGAQRAWWASEIDLSTVETTVAQRLIEQNYEILEPSVLNKLIKKESAFRKLDLLEEESIKLGNLAKADYVVLGKAIASAGANVLQSNMRSCFANLSARVIRVKDGKAIAYMDASGNSVHMDVITGGKEALNNAANDLALKIIEALKKEGGK